MRVIHLDVEPIVLKAVVRKPESIIVDFNASLSLNKFSGVSYGDAGLLAPEQRV